MFTRLLVAYDESPEAEKALEAAIDLAKVSGASLHSVTVAEDLPPYIMYGTLETTIDSDMATALTFQREAYYGAIVQKARDRAAAAGVAIDAILVPGIETDAIVTRTKEICADLLIIGLHKHSALVDHLWGSTHQRLTCTTPCSILAVR